MRVLVSLVFFACLAVAGLSAQGVPDAPPSEAPARPPVTFETDAREVREQWRDVLTKYPPEVGRILKMDPTMLSNELYLAQYPAIRQFLAAHPEIARNPAFYLDFVRQSVDYTEPTDPRGRAIEMWGDLIEGVGVLAVMALVSLTFAWLVRTFLHHRRWVATSRVQTEVHNKLLDRFAGTNELLAYVQSPAGRRFLEAAPIPVETPASRPLAAPLNRILWSVQAGIVLIVGGLGLQYASGSIIDEVAQGFWTIGVLGVALGFGFVLAGVFSYVMSRRLGLFDSPPPPLAHERSDSPAL